MTPRERWKAALEHREPDRVPIHDSPWAETIRRWHREGLPPEIPETLWPLIPHLIEAGFNCLQPLEVKAGVDVRELKHRYGDPLAFMGGINVMAMYDPDPRVIEEEIRGKFAVAKAGGGYIYHSNHSVPPNVSFDQYRRVMEQVRQYGAY